MPDPLERLTKAEPADRLLLRCSQSSQRRYRNHGGYEPAEQPDLNSRRQRNQDENRDGPESERSALVEAACPTAIRFDLQRTHHPATSSDDELCEASAQKH